MMSENSNFNPISLEATDLTLRYGSTLALHIPSLRIDGRIIAIIGHNGSGKSTLIKAILELITPAQGSITAWSRAKGQAYRLVPERDMAFSQENGGIFGDITVEEYLKLWCRIKHNDPNRFRDPALGFMEELDIAPLLRKLGRQLSKGQRHRVQAAVGFLINPSLFLFDEPFDGLDIGQSIQLAHIMQNKAAHMAMVLSSHRMEVVERLADHVIVLQNGTVRASGSVRAVCEAISGNTLALRGVSPYDRQASIQLQQLIRQQFQDCLVQQIGDQLAVTGLGISAEILSEFLRHRQYSNVQVVSTPPSLVDAMQYHLQSLNVVS